MPSQTRVIPSETPDLPYVGLKNIEPQTMKLLGYESANKLKSSSIKFNKGDVLYGKMRPNLNKVWLAEFDGLCSAEFLVFRKSEGIDNHFLAYRLNAQDFVNFANQQVSGERPRVDFDGLAKFEILLAPKREQSRIVTKLDELQKRIAAAESAAYRALEGVQRYRAAVLRAAITGELTSEWRKTQGLSETGTQLLERMLEERRLSWEKTEFHRLQVSGKQPKDNQWKAGYRAPIRVEDATLPSLPKGWAWATVEQMAAHEPRAITDGPFGSNLKSSDYTNSGPRVIRLQNIGDGIFVDAKAHISLEHYKSLKDYAVYPGDLVIRGLGIPAPRACKIPADIGPAIVKADCIRLKVASDFVTADFVLLALNAPPTQNRAEEMIHGVGRPRLNVSDIKSIAISFPSFAEQQEIVREVERRFEAANQLAATIQQQLERSRTTRQSLLQEAFIGKLVPQDMDEEPASVLLKYIRTAREAETKNPKPKRLKLPHMPKSPLTRRPLLDVLREQNQPISPEQLFREAGFQTSDVGDFYRELMTLRTRLQEKKPDGSQANAWPYHTQVLLELKEN